MTHWMCANCGYYLQGARPPNRCPGCDQACVFNDVTCYRPECGGVQNLDPLLVGATLKSLAGAPTSAPAPATRPLEAMLAGQVLKGLTDEQKQRMRALGCEESYAANTVICTEGAESRKLYLVVEGQVAVESELGGRMRVPISVVSPGEAFGWSALVPPYRLTATDVAMTRTRVLAIEREALLALMRADPALGLTIMQNVASIIASRLRNLELELVGMVGGRS
jgi:CRP-like cAMP-binding protein/rubredoxin